MKKIPKVSRRHFIAAGGIAGLGGVSSTVNAGARPKRQNLRIANNQKGSGKGSGVGTSEATETPPFAVRVLNNMGFGPARRGLADPGSIPADPDLVLASGFEEPAFGSAADDDVAHFLALGSSDDERLTNYVDEQLDPALDDSQFEQQFGQYGSEYSTLADSLAFVFNQRNCANFSTYDRPRKEVEMAAFFRATYSRRQLFELTVDFWHNHFNVYAADDRDTLSGWASWDRDVIRQHTFGNFYQMVVQSAQHVCMLRYLDNFVNGEDGINENYCRELFELHCLGAEHYAGNARQRDVEALPENPYTALNDAELNDPALGFLADPTLDIARFYVDDDVLEAAQSMSGWRYEDISGGDVVGCGSGLFMVDEGEHISDATKAVLTRGVAAIPSNLDAETEGRLICKLTAYHPSTATYIARKLCTRLISDNPPQSVVDAAAATFFANRRSDDQIGRTLRTILLSDEFKDGSNFGGKIKRPFEYIVSVLRAGGCQHDLRPDDSDSEELLKRYDDTAQELFTWRTPDGFPDFRGHWQGASNLVQCWRTIDWMFDRNFDESDRFMRTLDITLENLSGNPTPRRIVEFWCYWLYGFTPQSTWAGGPGVDHLSAPTVPGRAGLHFMSQLGFAGLADADEYPYDQPVSRTDLSTNSNPYFWHSRLTGLVKLLAWSPQMLQR